MNDPKHPKEAPVSKPLGSDILETSLPSPPKEITDPPVATDLFATEWGSEDAPHVPQTPWQRGLLVEGRYQLQAPLGMGGMGEVWQALDLQKKKLVAIKKLAQHLQQDKRLQQRFLREMAALQSLKHPNIVQIQDLHPASFCYTMEYLEGEDLRQRLLREKRIPLLETLQILIAVCEGLRVAHNAGLIHRDLKPENIFLCAVPSSAKQDELPPKPRVVLLDFGIAFATQATQLTSHLVGMGTAYYTAPELLFGREEPQPASDLYSCGILLYEMLLGRIPTAGSSSLSEGYRRLLETNSLSPVETPLELKQAITWAISALERHYLRMLEEDPKRRASLREQLDRFAEEEQNLARQYIEGPKRREKMILRTLQRQDAERTIQLIEESIQIYPNDRRIREFQEGLRKDQKDIDTQMELLHQGSSEKPLEDRLADIQGLLKQKDQEQRESTLWKYLCEKHFYFQSLKKEEQQLTTHLQQLTQLTEQQGPKAALLYIDEHPATRSIHSRQLQLWLTQLPKEAKQIQAFLERAEQLFEEGAPLEELLHLWEKEAEKLHYSCQSYMLQHPLMRELTKRKELYFGRLEAAEDAARQHMHDVARRLLGEARGLLAGRNVSLSARSRELDLQNEIDLQEKAHEACEPLLKASDQEGVERIWQETSENSKFPEAWKNPPRPHGAHWKRHETRTEEAKPQPSRQHWTWSILDFLANLLFPFFYFFRLYTQKDQAPNIQSKPNTLIAFFWGVALLGFFGFVGHWIYVLFVSLPAPPTQQARLLALLRSSKTVQKQRTQRTPSTKEMELLVEWSQHIERTALSKTSDTSQKDRAFWRALSQKQERVLWRAFVKVPRELHPKLQFARLLPLALQSNDAITVDLALNIIRGYPQVRKKHIPQLLAALTRARRLPLLLSLTQELGKEGPSLGPVLFQTMEKLPWYISYGLFLQDEVQKNQKLIKQCEKNRRSLYTFRSLCMLTQLNIGMGVPKPRVLTREEVAALVMRHWPISSLQDKLDPRRPHNDVAAIAAACIQRPGQDLQTLQKARSNWIQPLLAANVLARGGSYISHDGKLFCPAQGSVVHSAKEKQALLAKFWQAFAAFLQQTTAKAPAFLSSKEQNSTSRPTTQQRILARRHYARVYKQQEKLKIWFKAATHLPLVPKGSWELFIASLPKLPFDARLLMWRWLGQNLPPQYLARLLEVTKNKELSILTFDKMVGLLASFSKRFPPNLVRHPRSFIKKLQKSPQLEKDFFAFLGHLKEEISRSPNNKVLRGWLTSSKSGRSLAPWLAMQLSSSPSKNYNEMLRSYREACPNVGYWADFLLEERLSPKKKNVSESNFLRKMQQFSSAPCKPLCASESSIVLRTLATMTHCGVLPERRVWIYRRLLQEKGRHTLFWEALEHDPAMIPIFAHEVGQALTQGWKAKLRAIRLLDSSPSLRQQMLSKLRSMQHDPHPWVQRAARRLLKRKPQY
ncbi:MAG: protein kinase [Myxococcales bacterium]|nr:protein kinase [Myxococcales bacterium]